MWSYTVEVGLIFAVVLLNVYFIVGLIVGNIMKAGRKVRRLRTKLKKVEDPCWDNSLVAVMNFLSENTMTTNPGWVLADFQRKYINLRVDMRTKNTLVWTEDTDKKRQYYALVEE